MKSLAASAACYPLHDQERAVPAGPESSTKEKTPQRNPIR